MSSVFNDKTFENRFELFCSQKLSYPAGLVTAFQDNSPRFLETEQLAFLDKMEFAGLSQTDLVLTPETRNVDNIKRILASVAVMFENYQKILAVNVQKIKSLFEYFDHIRFITQAFGSSFLHVLDGLDYLQAFREEVTKNLRITKNVFDYLANKNGSIAVESLDKKATESDFEATSKLGLFDLTMSRSLLNRQVSPGNGRSAFADG